MQKATQIPILLGSSRKKGEVLLFGQAEPTMVGIAPHLHHQ